MGVLARTVARRALAGSAGLPAPHTAIPIPDDWPVGVVAAARVIGIADNKTEARKLIERQAKWQDHAFDYVDSVPEVQNGVNFLGNAMSKLILFPAIKARPGEQPEEDNDPRALDALARLEGPLGGHSEILRGLGVHFSAPGECYLIGRELEDGSERWEIRAKDEVRAGADNKVILIDGGDSKDKVVLDENAMIIRLWNPHPRRAWQATSSLRAVLSQCEELLILDRMARAVERSRNNAGILKVPAEMLKVKRQMPGTDAAGAAQEGYLIDEMLEALGQPITDEGHPNAIVPHLLFGAKENLEAIKFLEITRTLDEWIDTRTARVQKRFAIGFNLPVEVTTGAEGLSGWTKFSVDEDGFKSYLLPFVLLGLSSLTTGYYHPMLRAAGVEDWQDRIIWYDAQRLIARINAFKEATEMHDRGVIRDEDYRRAGGFGDEAAPTEEEIQRRILWRSSGRQPQGGPSVTEEADPAAPEPEGPEDQASIVAGARGGDPELARLARRQADLDRQLYARLEAAFEAAIDKVLERAGTKVVSKSKGRGKAATAAAIRDVPTKRAAATLGQAVVAQLGLTEDDLLRGAFDDLEDRFRTWVGQAQAAALDLVPDLEDTERAQAEADLADYLNDAWTWTRDALTDLARERLYDPDPRTPDDGEHDASATVPFRLVREAVARAGGATGPDAPVVAAGFLDPMRTAVGLATGWLMQRLFRSRGIVTEGWEWEYGPYPRTSEFEPHADLDGTVFVNFDDAVLANNESWPRYAHFFPGDHDSCFCSAIPVLVKVGR